VWAASRFPKLETKFHLPELDHVTICQFHWFLYVTGIDQGTITAAKIFQLRLFTVDPNHRMVTADGIQLQEHLAIRLATDRITTVLQFQDKSHVQPVD
jgi:hypothetical protein